MKFSNARLLRLIAVFKFFKGTMLIALSVGAFRLLHRDVGMLVEHWVEALRLDPGNHFVDQILARAANVTPAQIKKLGLGSLFYAGLFFIEGTGLWLRRRWGEWVTVIITSTLLPVEGYEIYRRITWVRIAVLLINVAIVLYLLYRIRSEPAESRSPRRR